MRQRKNSRTMSETNNQAFGKFESLGAFLESYKAAEKKSFKKTLKDMTVAESATAMKKQRSVVEVNATIAVKEPDDTDAAGGKHIRMQIQLTKIVQNDAAVSADVKDALAKKRNIFVAVRFGDSLGIQENIPGLKMAQRCTCAGNGFRLTRRSHMAARSCLCCTSHIIPLALFALL